MITSYVEDMETNLECGLKVRHALEILHREVGVTASGHDRTFGGDLCAHLLLELRLLCELVKQPGGSARRCLVPSDDERSHLRNHLVIVEPRLRVGGCIRADYKESRQS